MNTIERRTVCVCRHFHKETLCSYSILLHEYECDMARSFTLRLISGS